LIVVDASVAVKWTVLEAGRDEALSLLEHASELVAPDLLLAEVANVLRKKCKLGEITVPQSEQALRAVRTAIPRFVSSADLVEDALTLSHDLDHSVYDCLYLACALPGGRLATADAKFLNRCRKRGFGPIVFHPGKASELVRPASTQLGIDERKIETIKRLSTKMQETFDALYESARRSSQSLFVSAQSSLAFDSPAFRRLASEMELLNDEELSTLVALGWLGRSEHRAEEWPSLYANAATMVSGGRNADRHYFMAQMPNVARGLAKLQRR